MALGECARQLVDAAVAIAVQLRGCALDRLARSVERAKRALVGRQLDHAFEPQLALDVLDRLPRLVRRQGVDARTEVRLGETAHAVTLVNAAHGRAENVAGPGVHPAAARHYAARMAELGLFPLPVVLFPTERIPLHIFEPRYLELIDECLSDGSEFGLVFASDDAIQDVGTRASVADVLERLEDGVDPSRRHDDPAVIAELRGSEAVGPEALAQQGEDLFVGHGLVPFSCKRVAVVIHLEVGGVNYPVEAIVSRKELDVEA